MENLGEPRFYRALGDPTRLRLLARLFELGRPATVSEIACCTDVNLSVVSRHLSTLREAEIVASQRKGKEVHYTVQFPEIVRRLRNIADYVEECCPDGISCCYPTKDE